MNHHSDRSDRPKLRQTWPLRGREIALVLAAYVTLTAIFTGVGKLLTGPLDGTAVVRADQRTAEWLVDQRTPRLDTATHIGSWLSETVIKIALTALVAGILLWVSKRWLEPLVVALPLALEAAIFITVTALVGRPRPDVPRLEGSPVQSSFPSGHVAAAVVYTAFAVVVFWRTRNVAARVSIVLVTAVVPVIVGLSRMYRGMHFLTDVVAGALLGAVTVVFTTLLLTHTPQGREARAELAPPKTGDGPDDGTGPTGSSTETRIPLLS